MWYRLKLSLADVTAGKELTLQDEFAELWTGARAPAEVAMFDGKLDDGGTTIYIADATGKLAGPFVTKHGGEQCPRPDCKDLGMLVCRAGLRPADFQ